MAVLARLPSDGMGAETPMPRNEKKALGKDGRRDLQCGGDDERADAVRQNVLFDDAKDAYNAQSIMWDKSEDKSDAEFQSLLAAQKAVTTAEEDYQKVLETTNRTIEDAQRAVELDKYKRIGFIIPKIN